MSAVGVISTGEDDPGEQEEPIIQDCRPAASGHYDDEPRKSEIQTHHHCPSTLLKDQQDILICPIAPPCLLKVTDAGTAHPVWIRRVVVENTASGPVEAADNHEVTLVLWFPAETLLAHR